jgi:predicted lipoprotein with Yx(FWY)xxD motif
MEHTDRGPTATRRRTSAALATFALAIGLAASAFASTAAAATGSTTTSVISSAKSAKYGTVLTAGNTVYMQKTRKAACTAKCLKAWIPVLLTPGMTKPTAGTGVDASKLGTTSTAEGLQITYSGKALYWSTKDKSSGQVRGNISDAWGKWTTVVLVAPKSGSGGGDSNAGNGNVSF